MNARFNSDPPRKCTGPFARFEPCTRERIVGANALDGTRDRRIKYARVATSFVRCEHRIETGERRRCHVKARGWLYYEFYYYEFLYYEFLYYEFY